MWNRVAFTCFHFHTIGFKTRSKLQILHKKPWPLKEQCLEWKADDMVKRGWAQTAEMWDMDRYPGWLDMPPGDTLTSLLTDWRHAGHNALRRGSSRPRRYSHRGTRTHTSWWSLQQESKTLITTGTELKPHCIDKRVRLVAKLGDKIGNELKKVFHFFLHSFLHWWSAYIRHQGSNTVALGS